ncbi:dicarboxylate/amino acid:cation symporter [bacterium]|nr:dicarboxylate/amino acid:cation symporter [bacterium]
MKKLEAPLLLRILILLILTAVSVILYRFHPDQAYLTLIQTVRIIGLFAALFLLFEKIWPLEIYTKILLGLVLGAFAGLMLKAPVAEIKPVGTAFIRCIQMIVIPLVFSSLLIGTASLGDPKKMGRIGGKTLLYYLSYTAIAIAIGLALANILKPGSGLPQSIQKDLLANFSGQANMKIAGTEGSQSPIQTLLNIIPTNPMESMANGTLLQIIFFAIFTGIAMALIPNEKAKPVLAFFDGINEAMIRIVHIVIKAAPYGVFALIAAVVGSFGADILLSLMKYCLITIFGMLILNFTYPLVVKMFTGMKPATFMKGIREPQLIAFSTSSSSATLPVTIKACEEKLGVPNDIASFVLPLGATVNMNGTAMYQGISALFIAQVYGINLGLGDQLLIVLTATLAAIGTAGAPGVGILMLVIVLKQVGIPLEGISLILGVERILDMFRTTLNITGDASAAVVIAASEGELNLNLPVKEKKPITITLE